MKVSNKLSCELGYSYSIFYFIYTLATILYIYFYPIPIDWDGLERFNSSIILYDLIGSMLSGNVASVSDTVSYLLEYKESYRTGQGMIIWPPLQISLLTLYVAIFGKSIFTVYLYSYTILFVILFFLNKVLELLDTKSNSSLLIILLFFTNPIFFHHIFSLNLRFGEILAIILSIYALLSYKKTTSIKYLYLIAFVSVLSVFYRLTSLLGVLPFGLAILFNIKNKKNLIGPLLVVLIGVFIFFGFHFLEIKLVGISFLERVSRNYGYIDLDGFYTFYQFSDYYKGVSSDAVAELANHRYELNMLQKFIFGFSGLVVSGIIFIPVFIKKYRTIDNSLLFSLFGVIVLYLILLIKHGAKPDYLLPLFFAVSILLVTIVKEVRNKWLVGFVTIVVLFNAFVTYTRYIHPYYEDINLTLLDNNKEFFNKISTVYVGNTTMKHLAYFSITSKNKFKIVEFAKVDIKKIIKQLKNDEAVVLNNGWNYRFANINYEHFINIIDIRRELYDIISLDSYNSHYILLKKI